MNRDLSAKLFEKGKKVIPGGVNSPVRAWKNVDGEPFFVRRAKGARVEDLEIGFRAFSWATNSTGMSGHMEREFPRDCNASLAPGH